MKKIFVICTLLTGVYAFGQNNIVNVDENRAPLDNREFYSTGGFPLSSTKYISIASGSPYFKENWMKGAIGTPDGTEFANLRLRLDLLDNTVIYLNPQNVEMVAAAPFSKITLRDSLTGKTYLFAHASAIPGTEAGSKVWYEVLASGKATLYKQHFKDISESKAYGSSITEQRIRTSERYFLLANNTFTRVKKPKEIADLLTDKTAELSKYVSDNKLSGKKEADYIALVDYYNSQK